MKEYPYTGREDHQLEIAAGCIACHVKNRDAIITQSVVPSELWKMIPVGMNGAKRSLPICIFCHPKYQSGAYALRRQQDDRLHDMTPTQLIKEWVEYMNDFASSDRLPRRWSIWFEDFKTSLPGPV